MGLKKPCLQSRTQWQLQMGPRRPAGHRQADPHRPGHQPFVFPCCEISTSHSSLLLCMAASSQTLSLRQMQCTCTHAWAEGSARRQPQSVDCLVHLSDANREIWMRFCTSFFFPATIELFWIESLQQRAAGDCCFACSHVPVSWPCALERLWVLIDRSAWH